VANGTLYRNYDFPEISNVMLTTAYRDALTKGGWVIVEERTSVIRAHYAQKGRNIWAMVSPEPGGYDLNVADAGLVDLGGTLAKACHVALYGVLFDFNKSTLQPSSDATLQPVATLMAADKTLKLEVQGHTDNVGNDAYNQTLSEARAKAVLMWFTQHGVAADRLTAKATARPNPSPTMAATKGARRIAGLRSPILDARLRRIRIGARRLLTASVPPFFRVLKRNLAHDESLPQLRRVSTIRSVSLLPRTKTPPISMR